ncbi:hypothetical protein BTO30_04110 [Domibacillus antri]|uniref:Uncharacterized protein n=1 Tax=Domibacillus antri TaxID=1714264 RepID=A0A1Q8Q741_9BACI|nr:hypothetical protein [Domibacillus antri]OLN23163.1 hypothetical protein BTO30_04110 [Domibacillus antri]
MLKRIYRPVKRPQPASLYDQEFGAESIMKPGYAGTDAAKVQKEIADDVANGIGAITSREAGHLRSRNR